MIYYISDTHFRDQAIFDKCRRPFNSLEELEQTIINNWNNIVKKEDIVYILGDIGSDDISSIEVFRTLNGYKHLIIGNHDSSILEPIIHSNIFESIKFIDVIEDSGIKVCICHYPIMDWMEFNRDAVHVYGHVHNKTRLNGIAYSQIKAYYKDKSAYNCGIDVTGYKPVTLEDMKKLKKENVHGPYIN